MYVDDDLSLRSNILDLDDYVLWVSSSGLEGLCKSEAKAGLAIVVDGVPCSVGGIN
jgi:hypothetical protein